MRYTVTWIRSAKASLMNLWIQAVDRQAVADASNLVDDALRDDPEAKGRPAGNYFIREEAPISVLYHVDPGDRMVRVIAVKRLA
jgi:hypothetical protein